MGVLGEILAKLALTFIREWLARADLQRAARLGVVNDALAEFYTRDQEALAVLVERAGHRDVAHVLRVRGDGPLGSVATFTPTGSPSGPPPDAEPGP